MAIKKCSDLDRLMSKVEIQPNGCWHWTGALNKGYAIAAYKNKVCRGHRVFYELLKGPIPGGLDLDHDCHDPKACSGGPSCLHRRCVNPDHMVPRTREENLSSERSWTGEHIAAANRAKTHCPREHEYTPENTYSRVYKVKNGKEYKCRTCIQCQQDRERN